MKPNQYKYVFLILSFLAPFGNYFIMDTPALLKPQIMEQFALTQDPKTAEITYSLLYSVYALPNIALPLMSGLLIDTYGDQFMTFIFGALVVIGWTLFTLGIQYNIIPLMILGRFLQGAGGESQSISIQTMTFRWFAGELLSLSQALQLSFIRMASIANAVITPYIFMHYSLMTSLYFSVLVCFASLSACIFIMHIDLNNPVHQQDEISEKNSKRPLPKLFIIISMLCATFYVAQQIFNMYLPENLIHFHLSSTPQAQEVAGRLITIPLTLSMILSPLIGLFNDLYGQRVLFMTVSIVCLNVAIYVFKSHMVSSLVLMGLQFCMFSCVIWPAMAFCCDKHQLGWGLGLVTGMVNGAQVLGGLLFGDVRGKYGQEGVVLGLQILSGIVSIFMVLTWWEDRKQKISLNVADQKLLLDQANYKLSQDDTEKEYLVQKSNLVD